MFKSYAAMQPGNALELYEYDPGPLDSEDIEVEIEYCGVCHSDLSMIDNEWGNSIYPLIAGHEVIGRVTTLGGNALNKGLEIGQRVGIGWTAKSCQHCDSCISGDHVNCREGTVSTIKNHGGFSNKIRANWQWVIPLPEKLDASTSGPLLCGGITVFKSLIMHNVSAMSRVGVIGIGGLGHIAIKILHAMGAEVTAFSSSEGKKDSILQMGASYVVNSRNAEALSKLAGHFDLIINTVAIPLDWNPYFESLAPRGRFHTVGAVMKPLKIASFRLIRGDHSISGSSAGSPAELRSLLKLASRSDIEPIVEYFPMSRINDAISHVRSGKANFRVVLKADF